MQKSKWRNSRIWSWKIQCDSTSYLFWFLYDCRQKNNDFRARSEYRWRKCFCSFAALPNRRILQIWVQNRSRRRGWYSKVRMPAHRLFKNTWAYLRLWTKHLLAEGIQTAILRKSLNVKLKNINNLKTEMILSTRILFGTALTGIFIFTSWLF